MHADFEYVAKIDDQRKRSAKWGQERRTIARKAPEKRNVMQENVVLVKTQGIDKQKFVDDFRKAVFETLILLFERRELDLGESSTAALHLLAQVVRDMEASLLNSTPPSSSSSSTSQTAIHAH